MAQEERERWGSDVPVSLPVPGNEMILVNMGAHGFSINGLVHNINIAQVEDLFPSYQPPEQGL